MIQVSFSPDGVTLKVLSDGMRSLERGSGFEPRYCTEESISTHKFAVGIQFVRHLQCPWIIAEHAFYEALFLQRQ